MSHMKSREELEKEVNALKAELRRKESFLHDLKNEATHSLTNEEVSRYSRHMFIEDIGVRGQEKLKASSVLIVGCGGLGCPAVQYLAAVGIGRIGLVDYDEVELTNLHRQVLHTEEYIGIAKVKSLGNAIKRLNKHVAVDEHRIQLSSQNAVELISNYNVVLDCTDNVATRYLLNDACVLAKCPLVTGAAVQRVGQLTVYSYKEGPCLRCVFPQPPPPDTVANCGDVGILPMVAGVVGVLEALQAMHIILDNSPGVLSARMLLVDGADTAFRTVRLRGRGDACPMCGPNPTITQLGDYEVFCKAPANDKARGVSLFSNEERSTVNELEAAMRDPETVLMDVRSKVEYDMCRIPGSINFPLDQISTMYEAISDLLIDQPPLSKVYVVCRRGNDSQMAVKKLRELFPMNSFSDIIGGLHQWSKQIDTSFPMY